MAIYLTLVGATTWMTFALARRVLFGVTALLPPLILTASIALIDMPNLFADETLLAFLLTASVLLLVKAHETARARTAHVRAAEAAARPAANDYDAPPDDPEWATEAAARPATTDFDAEPDDPKWAALPDDPEWAILDDSPPRRQRGLSAGMLVLLAGLALSSAIVVQPRTAVLLPFVAAWLAIALPRRFTAVFVLFALLLPAGWIARDYALYGETVPSSMRQQIAADPDRPARAVDDRLASLLSPWNPTLARAVHAWGDYSPQGWDYHDLLPASTRTDRTFKQVDHDLAIGLTVVYALLALLGVLSMWVEGRGSTARLIALPLVTLPVVYVVFHAENRVHLPLLPLLPLLSVALALGLLWLGDHLHVRANRR